MVSGHVTCGFATPLAGICAEIAKNRTLCMFVKKNMLTFVPLFKYHINQ